VHRASRFRLASFWLLLLAIALYGCERKQHLVEQHLLEFGTLIEITMITDDLQQAESLLGEVESRLRHYRGLWHAWEDSDLTRFNDELQRNGQAQVPDSLTELLQLSQAYHDASGGLFNPALGKLVAAYGFHDSAVDATAIDAIKRDLPSMRDLKIDAGIAISSNPELQIDLGGIAKGYAIGLIADYLDSRGIENYIVNAGGDMKIAGNRFGRPWRLGIQNPFAPGVVASLELSGSHSLFTSGNYHRQYRRGDGITHHIIDPRTGESSRGQSSATVLVSDPVRADVAATVLMIDGQRKTGNLALSLSINDFLIISESREMLASRSFFEKLEINAPWPIKIVN
jgi:thiamine biosynthesis lipoprotein